MKYGEIALVCLAVMYVLNNVSVAAPVKKIVGG